MRKMGTYANWSKEALISRILSLESNAKTLTTPNNISTRGSPTNKAAPKKRRELDFTKFPKRRVAIRFAYLGWNYHGLAFQKEGHRTVEYEILKAFYNTKCISSIDPVECNLSRCGRTDADVSAMAQVISIDLRSTVPKEQHNDPKMDYKELDYLKMLNSQLPADIIAYQICLHLPPEFSARFSCLNRHYHYYFDGSTLNIEAMRVAANKLVGEHDFRNFCKIDGSKQITNFVRLIYESNIFQQNCSNGLYYLSLKGTAFLWNQVRSIMAILFLVGQGHEQPDLVDRLLDVEAVPCRPAYEISWGIPLVLYNCDFPPNMTWKSSTYTSTEMAHEVWHELLQKQNMTQLMISRAMPFTGGHSDLVKNRINVGQGIGRRCGKYTPVMNRPAAESPEVQNEKWRRKKGLQDP